MATGLELPAGPAAIELAHVGKRYSQLEDQAMLLKSILPFTRPKRTELWALDDVDFDVRQGETVGVIGHNGAGKTTLLRLLAGVTRPSTGQVTIRGRVAPLISLGVGFHQEMSGRENVYVNGMLLGLTKREVDDRFDAIVEFSGLPDFIDTPVKFYSSGMFLRLGFAVAIHVDPQIMLVDEILAVGDVGFQLKCLDRLRDLQAEGTAIVLVTHSMHAVQLLCPRVVLLHHGKVVFDGESAAGVAMYHQLLAEAAGDDHHSGPALGASVVVDATLASTAADGVFDQDTDAVVSATLSFRTAVDSPHLMFRVVAEDGYAVYTRQSTIGESHRSYAAGAVTSAEVRFTPRLGGGGTFRVELDVVDRDCRVVLGRSDSPLHFYVPPRPGVAGVTDLDAAIALDGARLDDHKPLSLQPRSR